MKQMKYVIRMTNEFIEPYSGRGSKMCRHKSVEEYETTSYKQCLKIAQDLIDAPEAELTIEQIKKDFEDQSFEKLPEKKLIAIQQYYNGRLAITRQLMIDLEDQRKNDFRSEKQFKFDIPEQYNSFYAYGEDEDKVKQIQSSIEVLVLT